MAGEYMVRLTKLEREPDTALDVFPPAVKSSVMAIFRRRRAESHSELYSVAFTLNPRYIGADPKELLGADWAERASDDWDNFLGRMPDGEQDAVLEAKGMFDLAEGRFGRAAAVRARKTTPGHMWWHHFGDGCPVLQKYACSILSVTITASACERNWSLYSFALSKRRLSMYAETASNIVGVISNGISLRNHRDSRLIRDRDPWEAESEGEGEERVAVGIARQYAVRTPREGLAEVAPNAYEDSVGDEESKVADGGEAVPATTEAGRRHSHAS
eukprot:GHVU01115814.1.p1 GENE.GHVU01115814.1~~GHVU01115814.1.p1  ORF type:complete len:273 (-),score=35.24 GHVU01115814.1:1665-2483(-)